MTFFGEFGWSNFRVVGALPQKSFIRLATERAENFGRYIGAPCITQDASFIQEGRVKNYKTLSHKTLASKEIVLPGSP